MRQFFLIGMLFIPVTTLLAIVVADVRQPQLIAWSETMQDAGVGISVATDKAVYTQGESINMVMQLVNRTEHDVTWQFRNGQRYDFVIKAANGDEIWRWSRGRMFTMALGQITLGPPANRQVVYSETYQGKLAPGTYTITALLADLHQDISASLSIIVQ